MLSQLERGEERVIGHLIVPYRAEADCYPNAPHCYHYHCKSTRFYFVIILRFIARKMYIRRYFMNLMKCVFFLFPFDRNLFTLSVRGLLYILYICCAILLAGSN